MKKFLVLFLIMFLVGCTENGAGNSDGENSVRADIVIGNRFFAQQVNEIYLNVDRYTGQTIQYEGYFLSVEWNNEIFHAVVQFGDDCCGGQGMIGFEILLDGHEPFEDNVRVEIVGVLEQDDDGIPIVRTINITPL